MTDAQGSPAYRGAAPDGGTSGQPLADQPTEAIPLNRYEARADTPPAGVPAPAATPATAARPDGRHDDRHDDRHQPADAEDESGRTNPTYTAEPVAIRRADSLAGLLLVLAGIAAGVSLLIPWLLIGDRGLDLVRAGIDDLRDGSLWSTGAWQPLAVVFGGGVLFLLGLFMYVPARTHRFLGVLALLVSLVVAAGVLVPLAEANWDVSGDDVGAWFTVAVGGLGLLGALKALSTGPKLSARRR
jgi:hypothetical protein